MLSAALCAMSAAFAASAAYAARRVVQKLSDVESAVWFYADKVQAGEYRQDRAAGLQNDVSRKIMQAFQQCSEQGNCNPGLYLQRQLQAAMESAIRAAVLQGVADKELWWKCSVLEAKLCLCRDWLVQVQNARLKNGCEIFAKVTAGRIQMHPAACPQTRIAEWQQLAVGDGMQVFGLKPLLMQIEDRVQEVQTLCNAGSSAGSSEQLRAAVLKVQSML